MTEIVRQANAMFADYAAKTRKQRWLEYGRLADGAGEIPVRIERAQIEMVR